MAVARQCFRSLNKASQPVLLVFQKREISTQQSSHQSEHDESQHEIKSVKKIPTVRGMDILRNPKFNKSDAFTIEERQILGIHGLLPPAVHSQEQQVARVMMELQKKNDIQKYVQLTQVLARNERLFYHMLATHTDELMPIVYTPTVGQACQEYGLIFRDPRGLFITIHDLGHVKEIVSNWPEPHVQAVVMTDGERILGLGDLGCNGMGIPIGKLALYTACGGFHPSACLPICIDVGTDNESLLNDPLYIGLKQKRDRSDRYDELIDEIVEALQWRFGEHVLIQFEDFGNHNAFKLMKRYTNEICTFNDDIQGTAAVSVAGLYGAERMSGVKLSDHKFLFFGAGEAACGIAHLLHLALTEQGLTHEEAASKIWMFDKRGLIVKDREAGAIGKEHQIFAHEHPEVHTLEEAVRLVKPTGLIGAAGAGRFFSPNILQMMATHTDRPIIFALSNPTSHAECTAEEAYTNTNGKCMFCSGSPFGTVTLADGQTFEPGQGNNVYIFPGIALGASATRSMHISQNMFLKSAQRLSEMVSDEDMAEGRLYPPLENIKEVSLAIADVVAKACYAEGYASRFPEPKDMMQYIKLLLYDPTYKSCIPHTYSYPEGTVNKTLL